MAAMGLLLNVAATGGAAARSGTPRLTQSTEGAR